MGMKCGGLDSGGGSGYSGSGLLVVLVLAVNVDLVIRRRDFFQQRRQLGVKVLQHVDDQRVHHGLDVAVVDLRHLQQEVVFVAGVVEDILALLCPRRPIARRTASGARVLGRLQRLHKLIDLVQYRVGCVVGFTASVYI